jgi:hypothetical protein
MCTSWNGNENQQQVIVLTLYKHHQRELLLSVIYFESRKVNVTEAGWLQVACTH